MINVHSQSFVIPGSLDHILHIFCISKIVIHQFDVS